MTHIKQNHNSTRVALPPQQFDQATDQAIHAMSEIVARFPNITLDEMLSIQAALAAGLVAKIHQRDNQQTDDKPRKTAFQAFVIAFEDAYREASDELSQSEEPDHSEWGWLEQPGSGE